MELKREYYGIYIKLNRNRKDKSWLMLLVHKRIRDKNIKKEDEF
jgi:hypothetical protein